MKQTSVVELIERLIEKLGSARSAAGRLGIDTGHMSKIRQGTKPLTAGRVAIAAAILGEDPVVWAIRALSSNAGDDQWVKAYLEYLNELLSDEVPGPERALLASKWISQFSEASFLDSLTEPKPHSPPWADDPKEKMIRSAELLASGGYRLRRKRDPDT